MKYVIYKRLSKEDKSRNQYGFDSQQMDIDYYLKSQDDVQVVGSFQEFISGKETIKPELEKALQLCREQKATLVVAKLDRLSRRVSLIASLMESDIKFKVATLPNADNFQLHIYSSLAEQERTLIVNRVKRGLEAAKNKGVLCGAANPNYGKNSKGGNPNRNRAAEAVQRTMSQAERIKIIAQSVDKSPTYAMIAEKLNKQNVILPNGKEGTWSPIQVKRICDRHEINIYNC